MGVPWTLPTCVYKTPEPSNPHVPPHTCCCHLSKDLNKPELTGRRRHRELNSDWGWFGGGKPLMLEVEEVVYTEVSGKRGWEMRWRWATPNDVSETVI